MFIVRKKILNEKVINEINNKIVSLGIDSKEKRHFTTKGKVFFYSLSGLKLLSDIIKCIEHNSNLLDSYNEAVVDHAFILLKSSNAPATPPHQDRPFWINKEDEPSSMTTCWFALENINEKNGALELDSSNLTNDYNKLNSNTKLFKHIDTGKVPGQFNYVLNNKDKKNFNKKVKIYSVNKGDMIIFDAYELHQSTSNLSNDPRLAFKVVFGEKNKYFQKNYLEIKNIHTIIGRLIIKLKMFFNS